MWLWVVIHLTAFFKKQAMVMMRYEVALQYIAHMVLGPLLYSQVSARKAMLKE